MRRRTILLLLGAGATSLRPASLLAAPVSPPATLLDAPLEMQGEWGKSPRQAVAAVLFRTRQACLAGARLLSDRQPRGLRVENRSSGWPAIWLHDDGSARAWIVVNVGERDWSKLAYQFGHELGHVLANSWTADSRPQRPCQWLEEALVEAFSLRGLGRLADGWERKPPFRNDAAFANAIRQYRGNVIDKYEKVASGQLRAGRADLWFRDHRSALEDDGGIAGPAQAAVPMLLRELETDIGGIEDIGGLNRWPGRSSVPVEQYVRFWQESCSELGTAGRLPRRLVELLDLG